MSELAPETAPTSDLLKQALSTATGIAFDGCHKIYVLLDDHQLDLMQSHGYGENSSELMVIETEQDRDQAFEIVTDWFEDSCSLRFISTVRTVAGDPNEGFTHIIAQFEDWID